MQSEQQPLVLFAKSQARKGIHYHNYVDVRIAYERSLELDGCYYCGSHDHRSSDCHEN